MSRPPAATLVSSGDGYIPGVCNIGSWEIRRRRAFALLAFGVAGIGLVLLLAIGASPAVRVILLLPVWGGMFSWLQARRRFCAAFAMGGIVNFGDGAGERRVVTDPAAHREDLLAILRMARDSFLLAVPVTAPALLLTARF